MRHSIRWSLAITALALALPASVRAQDFPKISTRQMTSGNAKVIVTGAFSVNEDVPINAKASFGDGEMTWIQFGISGSDKPNALITYGENKEIGITVGRGRSVATGGIMAGEKSECSGKVDVTPTLVSGKYACHGLTAFNPATGKQAKVDLEITFSAKS